VALRTPPEEQARFSRGRWEKYASDLEELLVSAEVAFYVS
jgi:hypothetical protein